MNSLKKILPLVIAFALGILITYVVLSMQFAMEQSARELQSSKQQAEAMKEFYSEQQHHLKSKEEKHWIEERIEQQGVETEERTKKQQSQGDDLKNQFDQFTE